MSSAVVSTSAAAGRLFVFDAETEPQVCQLPAVDREAEARKRPFSVTRGSQSAIDNQQSKILSGIAPASHLVRPAPEMASSGIDALDVLTGGLPRGCLTEICGPASSGRTTVLLAVLAAATRRGEFCALVDASDALDPHSAAAAGVDLERMLWVRCGEGSSRKENSPQRHRATEKRNKRGEFAEQRLEQLLRATDLLLESGGFGLVALDLSDLPLASARRIPLATWFRFRRAVEYKPTILLALEQQPIAGSCSTLLIKLGLIGLGAEKIGKQIMDEKILSPTHAQLLTGLENSAELVRSRLERKPVRSAEITFASKTAWAV
jgi:recombination protein RecA